MTPTETGLGNYVQKSLKSLLKPGFQTEGVAIDKSYKI